MKHEAEAEAKVLPLDLVEKILLWLPVKSLIRFRCVSKNWLSLISDSRFAKLHYDTADAAPTNKNTRLLYLSSEVPEACCVDLEPPIRRDYALQLPLSCRHFSLSILGSSRGFILLRIHVYGAPLLLWNPVTGSHRSVPYPVADPDACCGSSNNLWSGLGYDESSDDYLVVVGWHQLRPQWQYFSVRTNSWKEIECGHLPLYLVDDDSARFCNGVLYWLAFKDIALNFLIVAFDIAGKHLSIVSFPTSGSFGRGLFAGCLGLSYLNFTEDQKFEIWVMKESSWTKLNVVLPLDHGIHPLYFTKGELVGTKNNELVKVSDKGVLVESLRISCRDNDLKMVMFTESLLSLPDEFGCIGEEQGK